jgi:uncharacterized SAM-binding protein YcdF (DUF218 family)
VKKEALEDNKKPSDLIMVLGARAYINQAYNPCLYSRMEHAVALYKAHYANKILVSGGTDKEDQINEAQTMRQIAIKLGVPSQDILLESASTSTYENFLFSKNILDANQFHTVILVTEPFHSLRAQLVAKKSGFSITSSPAKESSCWKKNKYFSKFFIKEPLAIMVYKIRNRI